MKKNHFTEVADIALLRSLCEDFTRLTGFATALLDMAGNVLVASGWQEVCTRFHRVVAGSARKCLESDTLLADRLTRGEDYCLYRCGNGLIDVAVPIVVDGTHVGRLYSGQFLFAPPDLAFYRRQAAENGFDEASYLDAVSRVPVVSEERVRQVLGFLCRLAEIIVRMGVTNKKVDDANLIIKNSHAVLFRWKTCPGWPIEYVSDNIMQFGYTPQELVSREAPYSLLMHPEDLDGIASLVDEYYSRDVERFELEYRIVTKTGDIRWVEERTVSQRDAQGEITHYQGIVIDITERKQAERALRENEERLRLALTAANQGFYDLDLCSGKAKISHEYATILGYDPEEYDSSLDFWAKQIHPDDRDRTLAVLKSVAQGEATSYSVEYRLRCKSGEWKWILSRGKVMDYLADGTAARLMGIHTDISERVRTEEALKQANLIVENSPVVLFRWLAASGWPVEMVSRNVTQFGYTPEDFLSGALPFASIIHPDDLERVAAEVTEHCGSGDDQFEQEYRIITRAGAIRWLYDRTVVERDAAGEITHFQGIVIDVSEWKRAEEAISESEEKFRTLAETSPTPIILIQGEEIIYANEAVVQFTGYTREELSEMKFWEFVHDDFRDLVRERGIARERGEPVPRRYDHKIVTKGGEERWAVVSGSAMKYQGKPARIITLLDFTEAKQSQERMKSALAEKEALLKEVHHRVKNNLQIISSLLDFQSESITDEGSLKAFRESQDRITAMALIHEKLYGSRDFSSIDFGRYIEDISRHLFNSYIIDTDRISLGIDAGDVFLEIDKAIPCGLIMNELISNALKHAFPEDRKGEITVRLRRQDDGLVWITVSDNGKGFPPGMDFRHTQTLGLQLVNMLVRQLRGTIEFQVDNGLEVRVCFAGNQ